MSLKFAGTSIADFALSGSVLPIANTTAAQIGLYVSEGITMDDSSTIRGAFIEALTENDIWVSLYSTCFSGLSADGYLYLYDLAYSTTQPVYRIWSDNTGGSSGFGDLMKIDGWNGSSYVNLVTGINTAGSTRTRFDFHIFRNDTTGSAAIYNNGSLDTEVTGIDTNLVAWTSIDQIEINMPGTSGGDGWAVSAIMVDNVSTLDAIFVQELPTANGTNTAWTGDYTAIDETGLNTADFISSATVGQKETFTGNINAIIDSGYDISDAVISLNVENTGVSNLRLGAVWRSGGTDYTVANALFAPGVSIKAFKASVDPNTSAAWTPANIESAEFGVEYMAV